jgi:hypothetical protein
MSSPRKWGSISSNVFLDSRLRGNDKLLNLMTLVKRERGLRLEIIKNFLKLTPMRLRGNDKLLNLMTLLPPGEGFRVRG